MTRNDKIQNYLLNLEDNWDELSVVADLIENEMAGIEAFKFSNAIANDDAETVGIMVINRVKKRLEDYMVRTFNEWEGISNED